MHVEHVSDRLCLRNRPIVHKELAVENKVFYFSVGENQRGKFLRITESSSGYVQTQLVEGFTESLIKFCYYSTMACTQLWHLAPRLCYNCAFISCICFSQVPASGVSNQVASLAHQACTDNCRPPSGRNSLVIPAAGHRDSGWATLRDSIQRVCVIEHNPPPEVCRVVC